MVNLSTDCPICDAKMTIPDGTTATEILNCSECRNRVVVESITKTNVKLAEAPKIEEDWGE